MKGDPEMQKDKSDGDTKYISANVPEDLFWLFKKAQAERRETSQEALSNAIRLYVELNEEV